MSNFSWQVVRGLSMMPLVLIASEWWHLLLVLVFSSVSHIASVRAYQAMVRKEFGLNNE